MAVLYLIPSLLSEESAAISSLPAEIFAVTDPSQLKIYAAETIREARRYVKIIQPEAKISELTFYDVIKEQDAVLTALKSGNDVGVLSDAGCPAVADPGSELVLLCHQNNIQVKPLVGPSSIILGLMASGLGGQAFSFHGYLPKEEPELAVRLRELESRAKHESVMFIETPYRNDKLLEAMLKNLSEDTWISISKGLTSKEQIVITDTVKNLKKQKLLLGKVPAIYVIRRR